MLLTVIVALVLCVLEITALVVVSSRMKPSFLLSFLPEDVRITAKDHPEPPKSKQILAYLIFAIFMIAMIGGIIFVGMDGIRSGCGFWKLTLRFMVVLYINKAFDILVQDQWLVMTVGFYKKSSRRQPIVKVGRTEALIIKSRSSGSLHILSCV